MTTDTSNPNDADLVLGVGVGLFSLIVLYLGSIFLYVFLFTLRYKSARARRYLVYWTVILTLVTIVLFTLPKKAVDEQANLLAAHDQVIIGRTVLECFCVYFSFVGLWFLIKWYLNVPVYAGEEGVGKLH